MQVRRGRLGVAGVAHVAEDRPLLDVAAVDRRGGEGRDVRVEELVAAVGLWLATPWGAVVWLTTVVSMAVIELMFPGIYGGSLTVVGIEAVMLAAYLALAWMAARERPP